jgi:hypothetical protein
VDSSLIDYLLGSGGAAGLALLLILTGVLVPKPYHKRLEEEIEQLKQANDTLAKANEQLRESNNQLASSGQLTNQVMTALVSLAAGQRTAVPLPAAPDTTGQPGKVP